ncbi:kinase-like domain-containing protein [Aspergillus caelatus]|uniref:Kinase-like domain-containing protein n=1 Tax=Aspergillus caelatus TaxID=61420 RepID=A0A5N7A9P4_9EURO|nr:kinase-like domain-containing protein [Aspergillus caelatus]KAE8366542.1 kinase-like domain-containing protein [Aspergillus caelatus]
MLYALSSLASDEPKNKYVAVKFCRAGSNPKEVAITIVPSVLNTFTIHGPNGSHSCYVTVLARASLSGVKNGSWIRLFQIDEARALAAQFVLTVDYVHTQGIIHGDIHMGNILLKSILELDLLSIDQLYEKYGVPKLDPVIHLGGKPLPPAVPSHGIAPLWLGVTSEDITLPEARALLRDFGEVFLYLKQENYESHAPLAVRPPEARFEPNKPLSFPSDIWTLACTIWAIIAQRPLFEGFLTTEDDMACEYVDTLGALPPEWWKKWEARQHKFTEDGMPINRNPYRVQQPRRAAGMPSLDAKEMDAIFDMLRPMLSFRPENRSTTKQILMS